MTIPHTLHRDQCGEPMPHRPDSCCRSCGSNNVTELYVPGRVMGGIWVPGTPMIDCRYCGRRTYPGT